MKTSKIRLTDEVMSHVVHEVASRTGNVIGSRQMSMIEARLNRRAMTLGIDNENDYISYFRAHKEAELQELISLLTVHHTFFFREFTQFEFLGSEALPDAVAAARQEGRNKIRIWSAACSRGQEVYSLAMFVDDYLQKNAPELGYEILGTDIDVESVKLAANSVYPWDEVKSIPAQYLVKYWVRGKGDIAEFAKFREAPRQHCRFAPVNLMETAKFSTFGKFDLIFCRNVFIYFQTADIERISGALAGQLSPRGYLFLGLSESLSQPPKGMFKRGPSVFGPAAPPAESPAAKTASAKAGPIRVVCVDDSPVILKLLASILTEKEGFKIVGTAADGQAARDLVNGGLAFDVMTLDVHMPRMTGVEYLQSQDMKKHPAVVMLTSASRDNLDLAQQALAAGAKDYIEKPSLADLETRADEIRSKLRLVSGLNVDLSRFDRGFQRSMAIREEVTKLNVIFADARAAKSVAVILGDAALARVPQIVVALDSSAERLFTELKAAPGFGPRLEKLAGDVETGKIHFTDFETFAGKGASLTRGRAVCYNVVSSVTRSQWERCPATAMKVLLTEEVDRSVFLKNIQDVSVTPATSFAYMAAEYFGRKDLKRAA